MSHQNGLTNNATETTGFTEPDDGDDRIQKESENVAHARMVSNRTSSRIQDARGIRLPQPKTEHGGLSLHVRAINHRQLLRSRDTQVRRPRESREAAERRVCCLPTLISPQP